MKSTENGNVKLEDESVLIPWKAHSSKLWHSCFSCPIPIADRGWKSIYSLSLRTFSRSTRLYEDSRGPTSCHLNTLAAEMWYRWQMKSMLTWNWIPSISQLSLSMKLSLHSSQSTGNELHVTGILSSWNCLRPYGPYFPWKRSQRYWLTNVASPSANSILMSSLWIIPHTSTGKQVT